MLEPFQFEECEYSAQVRLKMSEWQIDCILRNVSQDKSKRPLLKRISGPSETPTLVDSTRDVILARAIHEGFYSNHRHAAATNLAAGSTRPAGGLAAQALNILFQVCFGPARLHATVSPGVSAVSSRTLMNSAG